MQNFEETFGACKWSFTSTFSIYMTASLTTKVTDYMSDV